MAVASKGNSVSDNVSDRKPCSWFFLWGWFIRQSLAGYLPRLGKGKLKSSVEEKNILDHEGQSGSGIIRAGSCQDTGPRDIRGKTGCPTQGIV